jgi:hypothetical protein
VRNRQFQEHDAGSRALALLGWRNGARCAGNIDETAAESRESFNGARKPGADLNVLVGLQEVEGDRL